MLEQTYKNFEVILVDDGSPDCCPQICDLWEQRDSRIHVIHQKNGGGGLARNQALNISRGEFVTFVDSDDYIAPIMFEFLLGQFQDGVDIVECDYCITENVMRNLIRKKTLMNIRSFRQKTLCVKILMIGYSDN